MKKWLYNALIIFFATVLVISGGFLAKYYIEAAIQAKKYDQLASLKANAPTTPRPTINEDVSQDVPETTAPPPLLTKVTDPETGEIVEVLPEFAELYVKNNDIVGWFCIPGTDIDYPVMQSPGDPDYYLLHNFDKEFSYRGCLYAQADCDVVTPSDNIVIYGHRMSDGSMFARLDKYMKEQYYRDNPYIFFDTLTELHTYKIVSVFLTTASVGKGFSYHTFVEADDEAEFNKFVKSVKSMALYDTGVDAAYGDKLITLSTCEYSQTNGRLVIVAQRIR